MECVAKMPVKLQKECESKLRLLVNRNPWLFLGIVFNSQDGRLHYHRPDRDVVTIYKLIVDPLRTCELRTLEGWVIELIYILRKNSIS